MENVQLERHELLLPKEQLKNLFIILFLVGMLAAVSFGLASRPQHAQLDVSVEAPTKAETAEVDTKETAEYRQIDIDTLIAVLPEVIKEFEVTAYTAGPESTGKRPGHPAYGITKSGARVKKWHTIAADPDVLPLGSKVLIPAFADKPNRGVFEVQDTGKRDGSKTPHGTYKHIQGYRLDIYHPDLSWARQFGRRKMIVILLDELEKRLEEHGWSVYTKSQSSS